MIMMARMTTTTTLSFTRAATLALTVSLRRQLTMEIRPPESQTLWRCIAADLMQHASFLEFAALSPNCPC